MRGKCLRGGFFFEFRGVFLGGFMMSFVRSAFTLLLCVC